MTFVDSDWSDDIIDAFMGKYCLPRHESRCDLELVRPFSTLFGSGTCHGSWHDWSNNYIMELGFELY